MNSISQAFFSSAVSPHVLVVGDVMLDRYWFGDAKRISPEAPVPIVKIDHAEHRLGGAANVALNVVSLGARATLIGVTGTDEPASQLNGLLDGRHIRHDMVCEPDFPTIVKLRVIGQQQQLLRIDFEKPPSVAARQAMLDHFRRHLVLADVVIVSDYGKGSLEHITTMIELARRNRKPVLIDPKGDDYEKYSRATAITPNANEFRELAGRWETDAELERKAADWRQRLAVDYLLVTRSEAGMSLFGQQTVVHDRAYAKEVFDVSGAGDTVIAALAVMLGKGLPMPQAMHIANRAAGIVVGKLGTATVTVEELRQELAKDEPG
ncbi:MAG: D-glycero-beta-D-manno-heptose-7-phosphate kinase [Burkholderiaceae bacterium]